MNNLRTYRVVVLLHRHGVAGAEAQNTADLRSEIDTAESPVGRVQCRVISEKTTPPNENSSRLVAPGTAPRKFGWCHCVLL